MSGAILQFPLYTFTARTGECLALLVFTLKPSTSAFIQADTAERDHTGAPDNVTALVTDNWCAVPNFGVPRRCKSELGSSGMLRIVER
jgi:hypothetical protein